MITTVMLLFLNSWRYKHYSAMEVTNSKTFLILRLLIDSFLCLKGDNLSQSKYLTR